MKRFLLLLTLLLILVTGVMVWMTKGKTTQQGQLEHSHGEALVGGDFTLIDQAGNTVRDEDFRGKLMLVFFGFTHCPDICPISIATLSKVLASLGDQADQLAVLFITVDPQRDTPEVLKAYIEPFDARIVGLTGTPEQIKDVAGAYKTYYARPSTLSHESGHEGHGAHAGHGAHDGHGQQAASEYTVDHSGFIYFMDRQGKYVQLFPYNASEQDIVNAVKPHLQ